MPQIVCPECSADYEILDDQIGRRVKCAGCGHKFTAHAIPEITRIAAADPPAEAPAPSPSLLYLWIECALNYLPGRLMVLVGWYLLAYFFVIYDASVAATDGDRIFNTGRMNHQLCGCVVGAAFFIAGISFFSAERRRPNLFDRFAIMIAAAVPFGFFAISTLMEPE